jgi:hypothetical protein
MENGLSLDELLLALCLLICSQASTYTRKNAQVVTGQKTSCYKSFHKLLASRVGADCSHVVATSLIALSDSLQGCFIKSDAASI